MQRLSGHISTLLQAGDGHVFRIPLDGRTAVTRRAGRRELDAIDRELQAIALVERGVEEEAVVVLAVTAENDRLAVAAQVVCESEPRLVFALIRLTLIAVREIIRRDFSGQAGHDIRRRDVVLVEHVRLVIPSQSEAELEILVDRPLVRAINAVFAIVRGENRIAEADLRFIRLIERQSIGRIDPEIELRISKEALIDAIMEQIEVAADLDVVLPLPVHRREVVVIAERETTLVEFLRRAVAAEADDAFIIESDEIGIQGRRVPSVALQTDAGLIECVVARQLMAQCRVVDPVAQVGRRLE